MNSSIEVELCTCSSLPANQSCHACVATPWKPAIRKRLQILAQKHYEKYPQARKEYVTAMQDEILRKVYAAIAEVYDPNDDERVKINATFISKSISNAHAKVAERRQELIARYLVTPVERAISQHFQPLVKDVRTSLSPSEGFCGQCIRQCQRQRHGYDTSDDDTDSGYDSEMAAAVKWREKNQDWSKYPPPELRDFLIEMCLVVVPAEDEQEVFGGMRIFARSTYYIHEWFLGRMLL